MDKTYYCIFIEKLGSCNSSVNPAEVRINKDRVLFRLSKGAKYSNTLKNILSASGILLENSLNKCVQKKTLTESAKKGIISNWAKLKKNNDSEYKIEFIK